MRTAAVKVNDIERKITVDPNDDTYKVDFDDSSMFEINIRKGGVHLKGGDPGLFLASEADLDTFAKGLTKAWQQHKKLSR